MPSAALIRWTSGRSAELDELESAHASVGGTGRGRRYATQQINRAYAVLLASQFQGYCRDLHSECIEAFLPMSVSQDWRTALRATFKLNRKLDTGNPSPSNIGSDFGRFGIEFWTRVERGDPLGRARRDTLERLMLWRNAIAHQDFRDSRLGQGTLRLAEVRSWRRACDTLATVFDDVMAGHISATTGRSPWSSAGRTP
jgi:hypothetical protein